MDYRDWLEIVEENGPIASLSSAGCQNIDGTDSMKDSQIALLCWLIRRISDLEERVNELEG